MQWKDHLKGLERMRDDTHSSHQPSRKYAKGGSIKGSRKRFPMGGTTASPEARERFEDMYRGTKINPSEQPRFLRPRRERSQSPIARARARSESPISKYFTDDFHSNHYMRLPEGQDPDEFVNKVAINKIRKRKNELSSMLLANEAGEKDLKEHIKSEEGQERLSRPGLYNLPLRSEDKKIYRGVTASQNSIQPHSGNFNMLVGARPKYNKNGELIRYVVKHNKGFRGGEGALIPYEKSKKLSIEELLNRHKPEDEHKDEEKGDD